MHICLDSTLSSGHPLQAKRQKLKDSSATAYIGAEPLEGAEGASGGGSGSIITASDGGSDVRRNGMTGVMPADLQSARIVTQCMLVMTPAPGPTIHCICHAGAPCSAGGAICGRHRQVSSVLSGYHACALTRLPSPLACLPGYIHQFL